MMREFESTFREGLKKGLRKHHDNPRNVEGLVKCLNAKPSEGGLTPIVPVTYPVTDASGALSWPYPQVFRIPGLEISYTISLVDSLEFDDTYARYVQLCHVSGNVYLIAYQDSDNDGYMKTVTIDTVGDISVDVIDSGEFDTTYALQISVAKVANSTTYALAYRSSDNYGELATVTISDAGAITEPAVATWVFTSDTTSWPKLYQISDNYFAIVFADTNADGYIKTVKIDDDGTISSEIDSLEFDADRGESPVMVRVHENMYAIFYSGPGVDGWICTVEISPTGVIAAAVTNTMEFDTSSGQYLDAVAALGRNIFAVPYRGVSDDGFLATIGISDKGIIRGTAYDSLEFDTTELSYHPSICRLERSGLVIVGYNQSFGGKGYLKLFQVDGAGEIVTGAALATLEFESVVNSEPDIIHIDGDYFAIAYSGPGSDGWLRTFKVVGS